ncbi:MAG: hypothetical protein MUF14_07795, partial [Hyphomonadaceae bacterium]|nr:hypothetical protein [Hyphomonadaceae bacterium]
RLAEIKAWLDSLRSPFRTAESFYAEEIIDPRETRRLICEWAGLAQRQLQTGRVHLDAPYCSHIAPNSHQ